MCRKWEVLATVIGEVTDGDRLRISWHGETVVDVPPRTVAHQGPVYRASGRAPRVAGRAQRRPHGQPAAARQTGDELRATLLALLGSPHLCSRAFITQQYDRYVRGNTVLAEHADSGMLRIDESTGRGIAVSTDASGRYAVLDPYTGAQLALAEAYRNVTVTGATPVAVTNCLNFGSPEDPGVMWQFAQAVRGLADGCAALGIPVTGGNVSFYNQTGSTAIQPTPVVGGTRGHSRCESTSGRLTWAARRARRCCYSVTPEMNSTARCGHRSVPGISAGGRRPSTWAANGCWPKC